MTTDPGEKLSAVGSLSFSVNILQQDFVCRKPGKPLSGQKSGQGWSDVFRAGAANAWLGMEADVYVRNLYTRESALQELSWCVLDSCVSYFTRKLLPGEIRIEAEQGYAGAGPSRVTGPDLDFLETVRGQLPAYANCQQGGRGGVEQGATRGYSTCPCQDLGFGSHHGSVYIQMECGIYPGSMNEVLSQRIGE